MDGTSARAVLGLRPDAPTHDVKVAYRALVKRAHPDRGGDRQWFAALTDAYEVARRTPPPPTPRRDCFLRSSSLSRLDPLPMPVRRATARPRTFAQELAAALAR